MKIIRIKDYYGNYQEVPVSDELFEEWRILQNETQRTHHKEVYHRDWTPMDDIAEDCRYTAGETPEERIIRQYETEALYRAIAQLSPIQQRRIRLYMENISVREIAKQEGCYMNSVLKSINSALKKLRSLLTE